MKTLNELQKMTVVELKEFLKENIQSEDFLKLVESNLSDYLPLLLNCKFISKSVTDIVIKKNQVSFFLKMAITNDFCPSFDLIEELTESDNIDGQLIHDLVSKFPTLPVNIQFLMRLINTNTSPGAITVYLSRPEFAKPELLMLMHKNGLTDERLVELSLNNENVSAQILNHLSEGEEIGYSLELINKLLEKAVMPSKFDFDYLMKIIDDLTLDNQELVLTGYINRQSDRYNNKVEIEWTANFEKMPDRLFYKTIVKNAPVSSKFRLKSVLFDPTIADDEELLIILNTVSSFNATVAINVIERSLSFVEKIDITKIEDALSPGRLAEAVGRNDQNHSKKLYFYEKLSAKYRPALYKMIPIDLVPENKSSRKTSYYFEAFDALERDNLDAFRESLSHGYDINKFVSDCFQSSKKRSCELLSIDGDLVKSFTKEELLALVKTPFNLSRFSIDRFKYPYTLTAEEAYSIKDKMSIEMSFVNCEDKVSFLNYEEITADDLAEIYRNFMEEINANSSLLQAYLNQSKANGDLTLNDDMVKSLCSILTLAEIKALGQVENHYKTECLTFKTKDGHFYISQAEILEMLGERSTIESQSFLENLYQRDSVFADQVIEAYLEGNKGLSALAGTKINIKRQALELFTKFKSQIKLNPETQIDEIFANGGVYEDFESQVLHFKENLALFGKNRIVKVAEANLEDMYKYEIDNIQLDITEMNILSRNHYSSLGEDFMPKVKIVNVGRVVIGSRGLDKNNINEVKEFLTYYGIDSSKVTIDEDNPICLLRLAMESSDWVRVEDAVAPFLNGLDYIHQLDYPGFVFLENFGLLITDDFVYSVLEHHVRDKEIMTWLSSRIGGFANYVISESDTSYCEEDEIVLLKKHGLNILEDNKIKLLKLENKLQSEGCNFEAIDISNFSLKDKHYIIKYIEGKIDSNYSKLDLMSSNIDSLDVLLPYESMRKIYSLDDSDIFKQLNVPTNLTSNKKILKSMKDYMTLHGAGFVYKVDCLKQVVQIINPQIELTLADFINYDNVLEVTESETMSAIEISVLLKVITQSESIKNNSIFLKNQKKSSVFKFLRTASSHGDNYVRDILEMINAVINGLEALTNRIETLKEDEESNREIIEELITSMTGIDSRLKEISLMDDAEHMHDRLVPLQSFIKADPLQPLGQDKFKKLEALSDSELGFKLFFPKTRGDLQYLGDTNGWCVNNHKSYGDNVIKSGNILVGLCEKGQDSNKENVIALAHFINKGKNSYQLEQLKWSSRKKNGSRNVDATGSFNHGKIISLIKDYLANYKKDKQYE